MENDLDAWTAGLREHRRRLASELERVDAALAALTGVAEAAPRRTQPRETIAGTGPMIDRLIDMFEEHSKTSFTAESALKTLRETGWESDATDPVNAMRTALSRMARRGEIRRAGRGVYRKRSEEDDQLHKQLTTDPWATSSTDDETPPF